MGVANDRRAISQCARNCECRQFVNQLRNFFPVNHRAFERYTGDFGDTARFQLIGVFNRFAHLRPHSHQNTQQCCPGVIQSNVANEQVAAGLGSGRDQPKGGRRNVAWN